MDGVLDCFDVDVDDDSVHVGRNALLDGAAVDRVRPVTAANLIKER